MTGWPAGDEYERSRSGSSDPQDAAEPLILTERDALSHQEGGSHYDMPIQPIAFIHANGIPFMAGNVIKYLSRYRDKGGASDIKKAIHYCHLILKLEYNEEG